MTNSIDVYNSISGGAEDYVRINESRAFPTKDDYHIGFITRYFVKRVNHFPGEVTEINKDTYERLTQNKFYIAIEVSWKITGPENDYIDKSSFIKTVHGVRNSNLAIIQEFADRIPELRYKLPDLLQFWRGS